ncbi:MAG: FAD-dependent oxidoreductase [Betaproteobacteria bacterium]|nr:FAD-dependent oxidoreductase [Betaproteobacteria bacterium]
MNVAVIGGGYAGMAAAVTLAERRVPVTVFEAARTLGGRARRVEHRELALDNGLHILIGAFRETLRLMRLVGGNPERQLLRIPFTWKIHERFSLQSANLPSPLNLLAGLLAAHGISFAERLSAARFVLRMRRRDYTLSRDMGVAQLLDEEGQSPGISRLLWWPLCVSALNTRPEAASAQVFLRVLRDSLDADRAASDLLLPRTDLSALFPEPAAAYVKARGGAVLTGERVTAIDPGPDGYTVRSTAGERVFSHVICALPPYQVRAFLIGISALAEVAEAVDRLAYQPIYSVYLCYPQAFRLPAPMLGFDSALLQWAFDRGALCGQKGVVGLVISAQGAHEDLAQDELARLAHQELQQQLGPLPAPSWHRVIAEKRATFACIPGLKRPEPQTPLRNFLLAGDYTASDYPATLEAAVRSGVACARAIIGTA